MFNLIVLMLVTGGIGYLIGREMKKRSGDSDETSDEPQLSTTE